MKEVRPRVSVVIAAYNHREFVRECIDSVRAQTFTDWEIVVTDDGSVDGTRDVLEELSDPDQRIRLHAFASNQGACVAMNDAIARARGEFAAVLNSDDRFHPTKLERQVAFLDAHPKCGAVFALPRFIDDQGAEFLDPGHKDYTIFQVENRSRAEWLWHFFRFGNCLCHPSVLIRRTCYSDLGGYDPRLAQVPDLDMWVRLCSRYEIYVIQEALVDFRILPGERNASAARPEVIARDAWERLPVLRHYLDFDAELHTAVFPSDFMSPSLPGDTPLPVRVARMALAIGGPAHRALAVEVLYDALGHWTPGERGVPSYAEFLRLNAESDVFGQRAIRSMQEELVRLRAS